MGAGRADAKGAVVGAWREVLSPRGCTAPSGGYSPPRPAASTSSGWPRRWPMMEMRCWIRHCEYLQLLSGYKPKRTVMRSFCLPLLFLISTISFGQAVIGTEIIPAKEIHPWVAVFPTDFAGLYHFGESEAESDFALVVSRGTVTAQIRSSKWVAREDRFRRIYKTLTNPRIKGAKFYSTEINGEFVVTSDAGKKVYGLKVQKPWSASVEKSLAEIGVRIGPVELYYEGKYPQASYNARLSTDDLVKYDEVSLARARNEIFARYGYVFSTNDVMAAYFKKQKWYQPEPGDVAQYLTEIEKRNIGLFKIRELEQETDPWK